MVIDVTDAGPGIPEGERERIFDPFYGIEGSRDINPDSTGVGLAIVQRAIERWGGHVAALPSRPNGTTFHLELPVAAA
jgi:two-component system sensor histidine kinase GlrK